MATPGMTTMLSQAVAEFQKNVGRMNDHLVANAGDKAIGEMVIMHRESLGIFQMMLMLIDSLTRGTQSTHKPLSECRSVNGLKILGSNKSDFKNWNEKFINAIAQGAGSPWRKFMKNLNKQFRSRQEGTHRPGP